MTLCVGARYRQGSYQRTQFDDQDYVISQDQVILWVEIPHGRSLPCQVWWQ